MLLSLRDPLFRLGGGDAVSHQVSQLGVQMRVAGDEVVGQGFIDVEFCAARIGYGATGFAHDEGARGDVPRL